MAVNRSGQQRDPLRLVVVGTLVLMLLGAFPDHGRATVAEPPESLRDSSLDIEELEAQALEDAEAAAVGPGESDLDWRPCYTRVGLSFQCTTLPVPLQYGTVEPEIGIALVRLPATQPDDRIGSLVLNPGGPGGSGIQALLSLGPFLADIWGPEVPARFDLVSFDPRGVGASERLTCFEDQDQANGAFPPFAFPVTEEEIDLQQAADTYLSTRCKEQGTPVREHMSTANVARDLDALRDALGDEQLTYVGYSYGSYLGVTYASLFPDRVRSVVVDGVIDPLAWANVEGTVPNTTRLRSDEGSQETLEQFLALCEDAGPDECAFAPDAADRFAALLERVRRQPIVDPAAGVELSYDDLVFGVRSILYDPYSYDQGAVALAAIESLAADPSPAAGAEVAEAVARLERVNPLVRMRAPFAPADHVSREPFALTDYVGREPFTAVLCEDGNNPDDYAAWPVAAAEADATYGVFGSPWTWASSACAEWALPDPDAYLGPFDALTANPLLVMSTRYDPATRLEGAEQVRTLVKSSALVTADIPGHTTLGISACAGYLTGLYLLSARLAPELDGFDCPREFQPFLVPSLPFSSGLEPQARREALPEIAPEARGDVRTQATRRLR